MNRHVALAAVLLLSLACSKDQGLTTIEEAEAYAQTRGVVLRDKSEHKEQIVAPRSFGYMTGEGVHVDIAQFASPKAAATWKKLSDEMPLGSATHIQKGPICFSVWGATDAERQKVIAALQ